MSSVLCCEMSRWVQDRCGVKKGRLRYDSWWMVGCCLTMWCILSNNWRRNRCDSKGFIAFPLITIQRAPCNIRILVARLQNNEHLFRCDHNSSLIIVHHPHCRKTACNVRILVASLENNWHACQLLRHAVVCNVCMWAHEYFMELVVEGRFGCRGICIYLYYESVCNDVNNKPCVGDGVTGINGMLWLFSQLKVWK